MHYHDIEVGGDIVDVIVFCSDACHRAHMGDEYAGWNGCQDGGEVAEFCAHCGVYAGGAPECDCQRDNVVINRFPTAAGERCDHGNWIQQPL